MFVYQLVKIKKILDEVSKYEGTEFAFAVFKNKQLIDKKLKSVDFIRSISPEVIEYENKRVELCEQYGKKDENGEPVIDNELYVIDNVEEFKIKMEELNNIYEGSINERQKQIEIFNTMMNSEIDFEFVKLNKSEIPSVFKTAQDLEKIGFMIE